MKSVQITDVIGTNTAPTAVIDYSKDGDVYTFDASQSSDQDGTITEYKWDLGDGTTQTGVSITHQFTNTPDRVTLSVIDDIGAITIVQTQIEISLVGEDELIIDNTDSSLFTTFGNWEVRTDPTGYYGADYLRAAEGDGSTSAQFSLTLQANGQYEIFCQYPSLGSSGATNTPFRIFNNDVFIASIRIDQQKNGGMFFSLGSFDILKGTLTIKVNNEANKDIAVDALKISQIN